jgi:hypothetical protein
MKISNEEGGGGRYFTVHTWTIVNHKGKNTKYFNCMDKFFNIKI